MPGLIFLKMGGSVITDKDVPNTADLGMLNSLSAEIRQALDIDPEMLLLIGHGSGSFGHHAASKFGTREGVISEKDWVGFCEVALRARQLNQLVVDCLVAHHIKAVAVSPFSSLMTEKGQAVNWNTTILSECLNRRLVPVIYGDVLLDSQMGGTILSTEEMFAHLAMQFHPKAILLAGSEEGIWSDFPFRTNLLREITPGNIDSLESNLTGSRSVDVTGGMRSKVESMLKLVTQLAGLEISVFSARVAGNVASALTGTPPGTLIRNSKG